MNVGTSRRRWTGTLTLWFGLASAACGRGDPELGTHESWPELTVGSVPKPWSERYCTATFTQDFTLEDAHHEAGATVAKGEQYLLSNYEASALGKRFTVYVPQAGGARRFIENIGDQAFPFTSNCEPEHSLMHELVLFDDVTLYADPNKAQALCRVGRGAPIADWHWQLEALGEQGGESIHLLRAEEMPPECPLRDLYYLAAPIDVFPASHLLRPSADD